MSKNGRSGRSRGNVRGASGAQTENLSTQQVAARLGLSPITVVQLIRDKQMRGNKELRPGVGQRRWTYTVAPAEVDAFDQSRGFGRSSDRLTTTEFAERLKVRAGRVNELVYEGKLHAVKERRIVRGRSCRVNTFTETEAEAFQMGATDPLQSGNLVRSEVAQRLGLTIRGVESLIRRQILRSLARELRVKKNGQRGWMAVFAPGPVDRLAATRFGTQGLGNLTVDQVAERLACSSSMVYLLVRKKRLRGVKQWRFNKAGRWRRVITFFPLEVDALWSKKSPNFRGAAVGASNGKAPSPVVPDSAPAPIDTTAQPKAITNEQAASPVKATPANLEEQGMYTPTALAKHFPARSLSALRRRLQRFREANPRTAGWAEIADTSPREERYTYRLKSVRDLLA